MSNCDCCRFTSEVSRYYDPTCQRAFFNIGSIDPPFEQFGDLMFSFPGTSRPLVVGGSGGIKHLRLPHTTITSNDGFSVTALFGPLPIGGGVYTKPTIGKQRLFAFGWTLELDWSDETLRAYSCDENGQPTGPAWYEQLVDKFWDNPHFPEYHISGPLLEVKIMQRKLSSGLYRKVISLMDMPIASKDDPNTALPFWYGFSAEHLGDDFQIDGSIVCTPAISLEDIWFCPQMPFIYSVDATDLLDMDWTVKADHYADTIYLMPGLTGGFGNLTSQGGWLYSLPRFAEGGVEYSPMARFGISSVGGNWGLIGQFIEYKKVGVSFTIHAESDTYFLQGTSNVPKEPKPASWDCDETMPHSLPVEVVYAGANPFESLPTTFDLSPYGLITPASPP